MNKILFLGFALALSFGIASANEFCDPHECFFDTNFGEFNEELLAAREEGKKALLLVFEMDECPWCARMHATVLNRKQVQDYYHEQFKIFRVDVNGDIEITDFHGKTWRESDFTYEKMGVRATPVYLFVNLEGEEIARLTGPTASVDEFLLLGKYVSEGHYESTTFSQFKRQKQD